MDHQGRQSDLKTGDVLGPGLKTEGILGPKNFNRWRHIAQVWGYHPRESDAKSG